MSEIEFRDRLAIDLLIYERVQDGKGSPFARDLRLLLDSEEAARRDLAALTLKADVVLDALNATDDGFRCPSGLLDALAALSAELHPPAAAPREGRA